jgi:hypothetical protein
VVPAAPAIDVPVATPAVCGSASEAGAGLGALGALGGLAGADPSRDPVDPEEESRLAVDDTITVFKNACSRHATAKGGKRSDTSPPDRVGFV